jgi:uncharacterized membrane protein
MGKSRLEAFSDGVLAIIITVMVLNLKTPHGSQWTDLKSVLPTFFSYFLSFIYVGIYWNNHHHLLQTCKGVNGKILWANLHLLFWLSLVPFVTDWLDDHNFQGTPAALYGFVLLMSAASYQVLQGSILSTHKESTIKKAMGKDIKGKVSILFYCLGVLFSFWENWISIALYVIVAMMWFLPDRRIENAYKDMPLEGAKD